MSKATEYFDRLKDRVQLLRERASTTQLRDPREITKELHALEWAIRTLEDYRYADIEHEHLGCHVAKTGIYALPETLPEGATFNFEPGDGSIAINLPDGTIIG